MPGSAGGSGKRTDHGGGAGEAGASGERPRGSGAIDVYKRQISSCRRTPPINTGKTDSRKTHIRGRRAISDKTRR